MMNAELLMKKNLVLFIIHYSSLCAILFRRPI